MYILGTPLHFLRDLLRHISQHSLQPVPQEEPQKVTTTPTPSAPSKAPTAAASIPPPQAQATTPPAPTPLPQIPEEGYIDIELSNMRRTIARRLTESKVKWNMVKH